MSGPRGLVEHCLSGVPHGDDWTTEQAIPGLNPGALFRGREPERERFTEFGRGDNVGRVGRQKHVPTELGHRDVVESVIHISPPRYLPVSGEP